MSIVYPFGAIPLRGTGALARVHYGARVDAGLRRSRFHGRVPVGETPSAGFWMIKEALVC